MYLISYITSKQIHTHAHIQITDLLLPATFRDKIDVISLPPQDAQQTAAKLLQQISIMWLTSFSGMTL